MCQACCVALEVLKNLILTANWWDGYIIIHILQERKQAQQVNNLNQGHGANTSQSQDSNSEFRVPAKQKRLNNYIASELKETSEVNYR